MRSVQNLMMVSLVFAVVFFAAMLLRTVSAQSPGGQMPGVQRPAPTVCLSPASPAEPLIGPRRPAEPAGKLLLPDQVEGPAPRDARVSVLVHLDLGADRGPVRAFARNNGGFVKYEYKTVLPNVMNLRNIPKAAIQRLEKIPGVSRVEEDISAYRLELDESTPLIGGLQSQIGGAGLSADGSGVRVCVVDTGIDTDHLMYSNRIDFAASHDFVNDDPDPEDDHGHGSHVAGIAVGGTGLWVNFGCEGDEPFQGIAPAATLIGVKVLNQFGTGSDSDIIAGIDHCADPNLPGGRGDVINLSIGTGEFGGACDTHSLAVAANNAAEAGVVVVAAAGNEGNSNALVSPACGSHVIAVGATYKTDYPNCEDPTSLFTWCLDFFCFSTCADNMPRADDLVCFSNRSDKLDVTAPGAVIWSASTEAGGSTITTMSGTSMASPHVAGLAALLLDADPSLTPEEVRQLIREGAIDLGPAGFDPAYGYGRIDVINSLSLLEPEVCGNGTCGAGEDQCGCPEDCGTPPANETDSCSDDVDNDCDGLADCDDVDCDGDPACICDNDGICEAGEDCTTCPNDCFSGNDAACGNGICEASDGEDCISCPADCNGKQTGKPGGRFCCGNGGRNPVGCDDGRCTSDGWECTEASAGPSCCGDGYCEGTEDHFNCEIDCGPPPCGDGTCDPSIGEDRCSCPTDCGDPPDFEATCTDEVDEDCDGQTDCDDPDCVHDPSCPCRLRREPCTLDSQCCSNRCHKGICR